ncbi:DUF4105 domain-containing protein [Vitiosangium sp. GDMCC 1.1324]|uniref:Lnb N-terminal periplasmic domain-containing protein n=1 Tax=Vitiosangium sp. (strain GDMCC 1.1324) TaxID=2138576 RepID=UPI000D38A07D|nr:DUF4105 domain-containing protein [Vitiosangium sp. GDMCC 1.1324]PTL82367.1 hypothetical protein DAT35_16235 [Vitiosangium sp. GDMCC 1.1324]
MPRIASLLTCVLGLLLLAAPSARAQEMPPWGTGESRGEDLSIYLATFGPGDDVASWWGHGSLVVEDQRLHQTRLYNYGMFSFDSSMLLRYAMGRLEFWVDDASAAGTFRFYKSLNRDVRLQELNLTPAQKVELGRLLAVNVLPENRNYLYQHYDDNCVTRLRDGIDKVLGGQLHQAMSVPGRMTLRGHTRRYTAVGPAMSVLLDFLMNDEIDKPITRWQEAFLPDELERQVAEMQVVGADGQKHPLVAKTVNYYTAQGRPALPEQPPKYGPVLLLLGLAFGGGAVGLALWGRRSGGRAPRILLGLQNVLIGLVFGIPGFALFIMWLFTEHSVTYHNENLFLANPLTLVMLPLGIRLMLGSEKARERMRLLWRVLAALGVLGLALKVLPPFDQDNWRLIALILPISLGMAAALTLARSRAPVEGRAVEPLAPSLKASGS